MVFDFRAAGDFSRRDDRRVADLAATLTRASGPCRLAATLEQAALCRQQVAADLAEILEDDAEYDRDSRGHVAAADPRLGHRGDERHALVLVDPGHRCIEADAV